MRYSEICLRGAKSLSLVLGVFTCSGCAIFGGGSSARPVGKDCIGVVATFAKEVGDDNGKFHYISRESDAHLTSTVYAVCPSPQNRRVPADIAEAWQTAPGANQSKPIAAVMLDKHSRAIHNGILWDYRPYVLLFQNCDFWDSGTFSKCIPASTPPAAK